MRTAHATLIVLVALALAPLAGALGGVLPPLPAPPPLAAPAQAPAAEASTLPDGCERASATAYRCSFAGTTAARPVPSNPVLVAVEETVERFDLPLGATARVTATAKSQADDGLSLAIDATNGVYGRVDAGTALRHARVADSAGTLTLVLTRTGTAGGAWTVEVEADEAPDLDPAGAVSATAEGPAPPAAAPPAGLPCVPGYCVAAEPRRVTDATLAEVALARTAFALNVTREGGAGDATVAVLDAAGASVATATLAPGASVALAVVANESLGTWRIRFPTDLADAGAFTVSGHARAPVPAVVVVTPEPGAGRDGPAAGGDAGVDAGGGGRIVPPRDVEGDSAGGLVETERAGPASIARRVGYFTSATLLGAAGVVAVALGARRFG